MVDESKVAEFYDEYSENQVKVAFNERHFYILDNLKKEGISKDSVIYEAGCGIGVISNLISQNLYFKSMISVDISQRNVELARKNNPLKKMSFECFDICYFQPKEKNIDFILLLDVLEHIPDDKKPLLIENLEQIMSLETKLIINIPYAPNHEYMIEHTPELCQVIETPITIAQLSVMLENNGLEIIKLETYDMWQQDEYQYMVIRKKPEGNCIETIPPKVHKSIFKRIKSKVSSKLRKYGNITD